MKRTFKVVMLPTEKASALYLKSGLLFYPELGKRKGTVAVNQHLYIISDDRIKEGDWQLVYEDGQYSIRQYTVKGGKKWGSEAFNSKGLISLCKKIIASTDKSITPKFWVPYSFVNAYVKANNAGKPITEINLEMEDAIMYDDGLFMPKHRIDGSVVVHQSRTYSRSEVEGILHDYREHAWVSGVAKHDLEKWIDEKIK